MPQIWLLPILLLLVAVEAAVEEVLLLSDTFGTTEGSVFATLLELASVGLTPST